MSHFSLSIAGLNIALQVENDNFRHKLEDRFQRFISYEQKIDAHIHFQLTDAEIRTPWQEPQLVWDDEGCTLSAPGIEGRIVLFNNQAFLHISPARSLTEVEQIIRICTAVWVNQFGGLMVHGAGIVTHTSGYLFLGVSGTGKTTVSRLSRDAYVLNDDLVVLMPKNQNWQIWATPFSNPSQEKPNPGYAPLMVICKLVQATQHQLIPISPAISAAELLSHVIVLNSYPKFTEPVLRRCLAIVKLVKNFELRFLPDEGFWKLLP